jgi:hypothetical protein
MKIAIVILTIMLAAGSVFGQQSAPTLRIVTDDPNLPSELFYGDIKVKPLRLRPGTNQRITIDDSDFFIQQHYIDFLNRMPEPFGFQGWMDILKNCAPGNTACDRVEVSSGFFRSTEFQVRGYFVFRFYDAALGRKPDYVEFMPDLRRVTGFITDQQLEANKVAFINDFMARPAFHNKYDSTINNPTAYVDALLQTAGLPSHPSRAGWVVGLTNGTMTRADVLRALAESSEVYQKYYNQAFVVMQYFGYLRRDPDALYVDWIKIMDQNGGDYRAMINGFVNSLEYRQRF